MKNIWVPLSGQLAQQRKVENIANNIANANTAGFKKDRLAFKEHLTALSDKGGGIIDLPRKEWKPDDFYRTQGGQNSFVKVDGSYTDFQQGALTPTNNPLDMALFGKGFFEVLTPTGVRYMRKGTFALSSKGELVTEGGHKLLAAMGKDNQDNNAVKDEKDINARLLQIPHGTKVSISKEGDIFSSQGKIGKVSVVEFKDIQALRKQGHSLFINNAQDNIKREDIATTVNQGFIEGSNVNAIKEMSELINAHRHFENIQKAINNYDAMSGRIVNDIADF